MTPSNSWYSMMMNGVITHLWQSTAFLGLFWLLTLAMGNYPARTRFSVWIVASIKFLVPFALLTELGVWQRFATKWAICSSGMRFRSVVCGLKFV